MPTLFLPLLVSWCAIWLIAGGIGMLRGISLSPDPRRRVTSGFWSMTLFWIAVDLAICVWALLDPVNDTAEFARLLLINAGLDVLYLLTGAVMIRRSDPLVRGFGLAIIVQGGFLLVFDIAWWLVLPGSTG